MAKVTLGPIVTDIRGKLGPLVFRKTQGTTIISTANKTNRKATEAQMQALGFAKGAINLWKTRTERDKRSWENWAIQHPTTYPDGTKKAPNVYAVFSKRYCNTCWTSTPPDFCRITVEPVDNETLIRVVAEEGTTAILLRVYSSGDLTFFNAGWFRLVISENLTNSNKKWRLGWRPGFNATTSYSTGSDAYGAYRQAKLWDAGDYIYQFITEPCYMDFHVIVASLANHTYATRDILGITPSL